MMSAFFLRKSGFDVSIIERRDTGTESTWAGGGILSPLYPWKYADEINQLARLSRQLYPDVVQEIESISGLSTEYTVSGLLIEQNEIDEKARKWCEDYRTEFHEFETPANISGEKHFVLFPEIGQVRNPLLAQSIRRALEKMGVRFHLNTPVNNIRQLSSGNIALDTSSGEFVFDKAVIAAGAWSAALLEMTNIQLEIKPIRGQMLLFKADPAFLSHIILAKGHYIIPRRDGRVLVGSTMEDVGFDKSITEDAQKNLIGFVSEYVPGLLEFPLEKQWSGLRPGSPRGIPVISQHPEWENLYINAGHFRNGVILAPASASVLNGLITGENPDINPANYSANKFLNEKEMLLL